MRILVAGSSGLIGRALVERLRREGHLVVRLLRGRGPGRASLGPVGTHRWWQPQSGRLDEAVLEGIDAVVNLAGQSIAQRWSESARREIEQSRVQTTALLSRTMAGMTDRPAVLVNASAVGYYGDRGDQWLDEQAGQGRGYLAELVGRWEAATAPASQAGVRTVLLRTAMVLSPAGGALARMLPFFRWGLGGPLGSGRQYVSWISLDDAVRAIGLLLADERARGPVNLCTPYPVTGRQWARMLGRALGRPAVLAVPAAVLRWRWGAMADEVLLASQRCRPAMLERLAMEFQTPRLDQALAAVL